MSHSLRRSASVDLSTRCTPASPPPSHHHPTQLPQMNTASGATGMHQSPMPTTAKDPSHPALSYERTVQPPTHSSTFTQRAPATSAGRSQSTSVHTSPLPSIPASPPKSSMSSRGASTRTTNPLPPIRRPITLSSAGQSSFSPPSSVTRPQTSSSHITRGRAPATSFDSKTRPALSPEVAAPPTFFEPGNKSSAAHSLKTSSVTLAVIGTPGCGKSSIIGRGLSDFNLSDTVECSVQRTNGTAFRYVKSTGRIAADDHHPCCDLTVLEVPIPLPPQNATPSRLKNKMLEYWPAQGPCIDAVLLCYDVTNRRSFSPIEDVLAALRSLNLPTICLASKSDAQVKQVDPSSASRTIIEYDIGLVEVSATAWSQRDKIKRSFDWILKAIFRERRRLGLTGNSPSQSVPAGPYKNPASPDVLNESQTTWDSSDSAALTPSRTATPTGRGPLETSTSSASRTMVGSPPAPPPKELLNLHPAPHILDGFEVLSEPFEELREKSEQRQGGATANLTTSEEDLPIGPPRKAGASEDVAVTAGEGREFPQGQQRKPSNFQWATLDELLDKLLFLAVSGDDPSYISHFLLTYRRFTTPRCLVLAMQKRMRQLDNPSGDPMFACFAQMRICHLLEQWIHTYPHDFAVRGASTALSALVSSIILKSYLLHYGSELLQFLEQLPTLVDTDAAWSYKDADGDNESSDGSYDEGDTSTEGHDISTTSTLISDCEESGTTLVGETPRPSVEPFVQPGSRMRKSSLPLGSKSFMPSTAPSGSGANSTAIIPGSAPNAEITTKQLLKELLKVAHEVNQIDSNDIAEEITRLGAQLFLEIKPRAWLHFTFVPGKKDPQTDNIARFNTISNHLADWVVSLILCHDKPKMRAKQIDKFVEVALRLRALNNYSALRAFVAGINNATYPGDQTMEQFKVRFPEQAKNLQSWEVLLQAVRSHRSYRMALKNSKGPCIPAQEVHMSDLIRTHEGNPETSESHPDKIHWGKFHLIGKLVCATTECQEQHSNSTEYNFPPRPHVRQLLLREFLMNEDMQKSRLAQQEELEDWRQPPAQGKEVALLRRIFF